MYCPRCGQQQTSGELRFCPRCGLKLDSARAALAEADDSASGAFAAPYVPRHGDINAGVLAVFLSVLLTSAFVAFTGVPLPGAFLVLLLIAAPLLSASGRVLGALRGLFSDGEAKAERVGVRPRDVGFGAALMLVCAALSLCAGFASRRYGELAFFAMLGASLPALLLSSQALMRATQKLFAAEPSRHAAASGSETSELPGRAVGGNALPPAGGVPVSFFGARETPTAVMSPPPSVAERTTGLLDTD